MPELAEVETITQELKKLILDNKITFAKIFRKDLRIPFPDNLCESLIDSTILSIWRRSKYILINLNTEKTLVIHLGMSGRLYVQNILNIEKHTHFYMETSKGFFLNFIDPRRFGLITLIDTDKLHVSSLFKHLGVEPFSEEFSLDYFASKLSKTARPIKNVLMDQEILVGIGNIYAAESLFRAKIHPERPANSLNLKEISLLKDKIIEVLILAIKSGGSSLRDYRKADGEKGGFQKLFLVYSKKGESCKVCNTNIEKIVQSGRSSFFCPTCQI